NSGLKHSAHFIDGRAVSCAGEVELDVTSPYSGDVIGRILVGSDSAVDRAVESATRAFRAWKRTSLDERIAHIDALIGKVEEGRETLERMLVREAGKPIRAARIELGNLLLAFRYFREEAPLRVRNHVIDGYDDFTPRIVRDPVGVVAAITPFNFPLQLLSWKLCPAVLAGCSVVCKPDPRTPLSTVRLAEWAVEVGWPPGVFNVVHGDASTGKELVTHPGVAKVAFT